MNDWISVKGSLPIPGERVLAATGGFVGEGYIDQAGYWRRSGMDWAFSLGPVTHWMPLPEPPREETT